MRFPSLLLAFASLASAFASDGQDAGSFSSNLDNWRYYGGWEFKGSKGRLTHEPADGKSAQGAVRLAGEFAAGGTYVAMTRDGDFPEPAEIRFWVKPEGLRGLDVRLADSQQQFFQYAIALDGGDEWQEVVIRLPDTPAKSHWGGPNDGVWSGGLAKIWICLPRRFCGETLAASCLVDDVRVLPR